MEKDRRLIPPGIYSTEFWLTLAVYVLAGVISLRRDMPWWTVVGTLAFAAIKGIAYVQGRVILKRAAIETSPIVEPVP